MIAFLLSPLGRKIAIYATLAVGLFFAYRWWSNHLIEQGRSEGRQEQLKADEKVLKAEQDKAKALIEKQQAVLQEAIATADANRAELRRVRTDLTSNLNKTLAEIRAGREVNDNAIDRISGDDLDDAVRMQLRRLATPAPATNGTGTP